MTRFKNIIVSFRIKLICFFAILLLLLNRISLLVTTYGSNDVDRLTRLFFYMPKDTVDCLFLSHSHVYFTYIPSEIYNETGITSALLATSAQSTQNSYWLLREALKKQSPKVVIMDANALTSSANKDVIDFRLHYTSGISMLPDNSLNKILAYKDITNKNSGWADNMSLYDAYGLLEYRGDYNREYQLEKMMTLLFRPEEVYATRANLGFQYNDEVYAIDKIQASNNVDTYMNFEETIEYEYLCKIKAILDDNNIKLLLVRAPYYEDFDDKGLYKQIFDWCKDNDVPLLDYFEHFDETGIDLTTDFKDPDHLNYYGAVKATDYFINYIKEYNLPDHRGDAKYQLWENASVCY